MSLTLPPPGAARWGLIGGKLSEQHICVNCQRHFSSAEHIWGLLFEPCTPFLTLSHPPPSKFPVTCHFSFSFALSSTGAPPPHTHQAGPPSLSIPLTPAVTHSCSTGGGGEPEPGWEQERKNEMRERKERSGGGSSLWECLLPAALWGETQQDCSLRPQLKPDLWKFSLRVRYLAQLGSHSSLAHPSFILSFMRSLAPLCPFFPLAWKVRLFSIRLFFFLDKSAREADEIRGELW